MSDIILSRLFAGVLLTISVVKLEVADLTNFCFLTFTTPMLIVRKLSKHSLTFLSFDNAKYSVS